jgi:hypothetical protein
MSCMYVHIISSGAIVGNINNISGGSVCFISEFMRSRVYSLFGVLIAVGESFYNLWIYSLINGKSLFRRLNIEYKRRLSNEI